MSFPVYASIVSFGFRLLYYCNTRYEWLVRPYSPGTFTLEETPSFPWRTNGVCYPLVGGTRQRRFAGTNLKPRKLPENAQTPTSRVHPIRMATHPFSRKKPSSALP
jgi:hypothetical protein